MSRRERVLLALGFIGAIVLVAYPLAYRIITEQASAVTASASVLPLPSPSRVPTPSRSFRPPTAAPQPVLSPIPIDPSARLVGPAWQAVADPHRGANGKSFQYDCSPNGRFGEIWGVDVYTDDSSVCTAGVHMGVITRERGGTVTIIIREGRASYTGSTRNGVTTVSWGDWGGSYEVVKP